MVLWELVYIRKKEYIIEKLDYYKNNKERHIFEYNGMEYTVHKLPEGIPDENIQILDTDIMISEKE